MQYTRSPITLAALLLVSYALYRYLIQPSFWLDESIVAINLKDPTFLKIFAQLENGPYFPRIYLYSISIIRNIFGYNYLAIRFLPLLFFAMATLIWAKLLTKKAQSSFSITVLMSFLLLATYTYLFYSSQIKAYSWDVFWGLFPLLFKDQFFNEVFLNRKRKKRILLLAFPIALSYPYPVAIASRVAAWYIHSSFKRKSWKIDFQAASLFVLFSLFLLIVIQLTDHRFNLKLDLSSDWKICILGDQLRNGVPSSIHLLLGYVWGWQNYMPKTLTLFTAILQCVGVYSIFSNLKNRKTESDDLTSLMVLIAFPILSVIASYPICTGRLILTTQIHTQLIMAQGGLTLVQLLKTKKNTLKLISMGAMWILVASIGFFAIKNFVNTLSTEPNENISALIRHIDHSLSDTVWVQTCSTHQVKALPNSLPLKKVILAKKDDFPPPGKTLWVLWTHPGGVCGDNIEELRSKAKFWKIHTEGNHRGLALARY